MLSSFSSYLRTHEIFGHACCVHLSRQMLFEHLDCIRPDELLDRGYPVLHFKLRAPGFLSA